MFSISLACRSLLCIIGFTISANWLDTWYMISCMPISMCWCIKEVVMTIGYSDSPASFTAEGVATDMVVACTGGVTDGVIVETGNIPRVVLTEIPNVVVVSALLHEPFFFWLDSMLPKFSSGRKCIRQVWLWHRDSHLGLCLPMVPLGVPKCWR